MKEAGFDVNAIKRQWKLDDILLCDDGRSTHQVMLNSARARLVAIKKVAIDNLVAVDDYEDVDAPDDSDNS